MGDVTVNSDQSGESPAIYCSAFCLQDGKNEGAFLLASPATLGKSLPISESRLIHLQNGNDHKYLMRRLEN